GAERARPAAGGRQPGVAAARPGGRARGDPDGPRLRGVAGGGLAALGGAAARDGGGGGGGGGGGVALPLHDAPPRGRAGGGGGGVRLWSPALGGLHGANRSRLVGRLAGHPRAVQFADGLIDARLAEHEQWNGRWGLPEPATAEDVEREWQALVEPALPDVKEQ